jgi:hypothetical protein
MILNRPSSLLDLAENGPLGAISDHGLRAKTRIILRMAWLTHENCAKSLSPTGC